MIKHLTPGDEVQQSSIGNSMAMLNLQLSQPWTPPGQDGEAAVCQPRGAAEVNPLYRGQTSIPADDLQDGLNGPVRLNLWAVDDQTGPQVPLPGQEVEPLAGPGGTNDVNRGEERKDSEYHIIRE